jgi:hypothetical protein
MTLRIIRFINTFMAALVMGIVFGVWAGFNSHNLSAVVYIEQQQNSIRNLNVLMPVLGLITIMITLLAAFLQRAQKRIMFSLVIAASFFIATGLITRFGNQVLNAEMMTWNSLNPPPDWQTMRDRWWLLHCYRTITALAGMLVLIWVNTATLTANDERVEILKQNG